MSTVVGGSFWEDENFVQSNNGHHPTPLFWYLGFHGNAILNFINTPKASTHYGEYSMEITKGGILIFFYFFH
jgi:hypothetical protein